MHDGPCCETCRMLADGESESPCCCRALEPSDEDVERVLMEVATDG